MPVSKRSRVIALTQTEKKTRDHKTAYIQDVREAVNSHDCLYLFSYENMRSSKFKNVRVHFRDSDSKKITPSRILLGKNKLLQIALGRTPEDEYSDNLRHVAKLITGSVGLLFTSQPHKKVESYFDNLSELDYARAGSIAPRKVVVTAEMVALHPVSMMEQLRSLGLPVEIKDGIVRLIPGREEYVLCKEGKTLTAEQCKLLVHFNMPLSEFKIQLLCRWNSKDKEINQFI
eukprot:CAMPEP_0194133124 /NCGR_PEP_ID=MMETSP0152-20130528/3417_1 /TAXON_ID=1049557 /ORGANISM="Thalassiothrix antarctica, Strain L6-D1" /LENGTH=230 /DNA_ID=CAMNT_0038828375 /DNA_START=118 /DNA_END=810 /DNA_ORIENTATION=-